MKTDCFKHFRTFFSVLPTVFFLFFLLTVSSFLAGCSKKQAEPIEKTGMFLDTVIKISIYDSKDTALLDGSFALCRKYEDMLSTTIETSEIYRLNHAKGQPVTVSDAALSLIRKGIEYGDLSDGIFDITILPLSELWDFKNNPGNVPDPGSIANAVSHVNYKNIQISGNQVRLLDAESGIDLGGIAKGFIADRIKEYLEENGVEHALINLGGNVLAVGGHTDGSAFHIGIQKPFDNSGVPIASVRIKNKSLVSSGTYQRYFQADGKLYHHILDPKTGYPFENGLSQVTILCDSSADADALSTLCFSLGLKKGLAFINRTEGAEALFITEDEQIFCSDGFPELARTSPGKEKTTIK